MASAAVTANSVNGQLTQLEHQFALVKQSAGNFEVQNDRTAKMLLSALEEAYGFGCGLFRMASGTSGMSIVSDFLKARNVYNEKVRKKPFIGIVNAAFVNSSPSSRSQYATVLHYAHTEKVKPADFLTWLSDQKGIEGARSNAVKAEASSSWLQNNATKQQRVQQSGSDLLKRPASVPVALPAGFTPPPGFAIVLASIDKSHNASIIHVLHDQSDNAKIDPVLLSLAAAPAPQAVRGLDGFYRAISAILNATPDTTNGKERHLLVSNTMQHGTLVGNVEAISEAYSFPSGSMLLDQPVGSLPPDDRYVFSLTDARHFIDQYEKHDNWALDAQGVLTATDLIQSIQLTQLPSAHAYRVADVRQSSTKQLRATYNDLTALLEYIAMVKADWKAPKGRGGKEKLPFPASMELAVAKDRLLIHFRHSPRPSDFADTRAEEVEEDRLLAVSDMTALAQTLVEHGADVEGWLMDSGVDDAALVLDAYLGDDRLRVVMPTRTGSDYNQVCKPLP